MRRAIAVGVALLACACAPERSAETPVETQNAAPEAAPAPAPGPAPAVENEPAPEPTPTPIDPEGIAGDPIRLQPLTGADRAADLSGELGCSFTADGDDRPLLIALGVVGRNDGIDGLVKSGGETVRVRSAGDYAALERGPTLSAKGMSVTLVRGNALPNDTEQTVYAAVLRVDRADGSVKTYTGRWLCGP